MEHTYFSFKHRHHHAESIEKYGTLYSMLGMGLAIAAAIISNLGVNIQKQSHIREARKPEAEQIPYIKRPLWILGMTLVVLASIGDFQALAFAPQALVAAVGGGMTVVANVFFAHCWFKQSLSVSNVLGTVLITGGIVLSALANFPDKVQDLGELEKKFIRPGFVAYMIVQGVAIAIMWAQIKRREQRPTMTGRRVPSHRVPYLYAIIAGLIGSFAVLLAKCLASMLLLTMLGENQFGHPITYVFIIGTGVCLIFQTDLLNRAIMSGDTLTVFPVFQCFWIAGGVLSGLIFYEKIQRLDTFQSFAFPVSSLLIIFGIYFLSRRKRGASSERSIGQETPEPLKIYYTGSTSPAHFESWSSNSVFQGAEEERLPLLKKNSKNKLLPVRQNPLAYVRVPTESDELDNIKRVEIVV